MTLLLAFASGLGVTVGVMLVAAGVAGTPGGSSGPGLVGTARAWAATFDRLRLRLGLAGAGLVAFWMVSGWPVGALLAAVVGFVTPTLLGAKHRRADEIAKIEAIAGWAEQLRDTIGASAGLQEAIVASARVAPPRIRPMVSELALGLRRGHPSDELRRFAARVDDPVADQIVVALILAGERRGQNLTELLSDVARSARDEATMRIRTETARAQTYSDTRVVSFVVVGVFAFMLVFNRTYLAAFDSLVGQAVLAVIGALWAVALWGVAELSEVRRPHRLLVVGDAEEEAS
ncbi:MAG: type II secretion system F family protein [Actinomycetota bacterium]